MDGGLAVAGSVVVAAALFETAFPRVRAAFVRWRVRRAETDDAPCGKGDPSVLCPLSSVPEDGSGPGTADGGLRQGGPGAEPLASGADCAGGGRSPAPAAPGAADDANRLWEEARGMKHRFKPNWGKDGDYLAKVYAAAKLGHLDAMAKLGEYAARRKAVVEAFYWTLLAELKGAKGLETPLRELRSQWLALGCPLQYRNAYGAFTEEQGVFARAVLRLQCGIDPQYARARLKELAARGVEEARLYLAR